MRYDRLLPLRALLRALCPGVLLFSVLVVGAGCELLGDDDDDVPVVTGVLVANQGAYPGPGTVSAYDPATGQTTAQAVVAEASIVQSLHLAGGRLYVVANNGDRIDVHDADTYARVGQITGLVSPRYMIDGPGGKAYVTNQYGAPGSFTGGSVSVIDLATNAKLKDVAVGDNPEGLALAGDRLYVTHHAFGAGRTVWVLDTRTDTVVDTVDVGCDGPRAVFADRDGDVVVFCTGQTLYDEQFNEVGETNGAIRVLDGATGAVVRRIDLDGRIGTVGPGQDAYYAPETGEIFAVLDGRTILRFDTGRDELSGEIGPFDGDGVGAVAYDAAAGRLYVGRVPGFTERGAVTIHDRRGVQVGSFTAGIAPTFITFRRDEP